MDSFSALKQFLASQPNNIFCELDLNTLLEGKKRELSERMIKTVLNRIFVKIGEYLTEDEMKEFSKLTKTATSEKLNDYLSKKIPMYDSLIPEVIEDYKKEIKDGLEFALKNS